MTKIYRCKLCFETFLNVENCISHLTDEHQGQTMDALINGIKLIDVAQAEWK